MHNRPFLFSLPETIFSFILLVIISSCKKDNTDTGPYFAKVKLIIQTNCTQACHAPAQGLYSGMPVNLETDSNIVRLANAIKSAVADSVSVTNKRMPSGGQLSASDIDIITRWAAKGGKATD